MFIIGCDFHSRFQQIAMLSPTNGEVIERRLEHENRGSPKRFYATRFRVRRESGWKRYLRCSVIRESAARTPSRTLDRRRGGDPCRQGAEAEDGLPRCLTYSRLAPRPLTTIEVRLEVCLKLHQKPTDSADDVIHGS